MKFSFEGTNQPTSMGYFKSKKGYNSKYKCSKEYANHYGEYISYIILKQLGKKVCKVDLGNTKIKNPHTSKEVDVEGILSHYQLDKHEMMQPAEVIISDYKEGHKSLYRRLTERGRTDFPNNYTNVEIILKAFEEKYKEAGQEADIPKMRKDFFDMCMFDLKFANRDRHDENFGLKIDQITGKLEFYHLFDDEQILGMQEEKSDIRKYLATDKRYKQFEQEQLTSCIGIPGNTQKIDSMSLLTYLLEKYPEETKKSLEDISRYRLSNLEELFNKFDGLSREHKEFAKKIFIDREQKIAETVKKFAKEHRENELSL